jgi:hypothetical protein
MAPSLSRALLAAAAAIGSTMAVTPAYAGGEASAAQPQPRANNPNRQVCRTTRVTGSRFPRQICRTAAERDAAEKDAQDTTRDFLSQDYVSPTENGESIGTQGPGTNTFPSPN